MVYCEVYNMRTNLVLDDELVEKAMALSGIKTKREVVHVALEDYVAVRTRKNLLEIRGAIKFADNYDYKEMRRSGA